MFKVGDKVKIKKDALDKNYDDICLWVQQTNGLNEFVVLNNESDINVQYDIELGSLDGTFCNMMVNATEIEFLNMDFTVDI